MGNDLLYEVKDLVAYMIINRESKRNAISQEMISAFVDGLVRAGADEEVRAVCITGKGDKAFCAGADLSRTLKGQGTNGLSGAKSYAELLKRLARFGKPLVARVNGPCLAGGLGLMLSCDIAIAKTDVFFCTPEVNIGIFPMMIGALIYRNVGRKKAMEMVLTGRRIPAAEAEQVGLITRAVKPDQLDHQVQKPHRNKDGKRGIQRHE